MRRGRRVRRSRREGAKNQHVVAAAAGRMGGGLVSLDEAFKIGRSQGKARARLLDGKPSSDWRLLVLGDFDRRNGRELVRCDGTGDLRRPELKGFGHQHQAGQCHGAECHSHQRDVTSGRRAPGHPSALLFRCGATKISSPDEVRLVVAPTLRTPCSSFGAPCARRHGRGWAVMMKLPGCRILHAN